jgi:D-beta-D-heptose 7-phosphate kinase/D-beta-D-heptose 1-phosphate adenosyltransferase
LSEIKIVFTNGCFDILHRGHLELLKYCRSLGQRVIVGINSDKSVRRLKGHKRPIISQDDRKAILEELRCVDEDTPYELIQRKKPDIIVKGGDYQTHEVVGADLAEVKIFGFINGYSTTKIIKHTGPR